MGWLEAILLGIVQGLTEFLPVSSSGHLALSEMLLERYGRENVLPAAESPEMLLFDLCTHVGTLVAVLAVFAPVFGRYLRSLWAELPRWRQLRSAKKPAALHVTILAIAACLVTGVVGLTFKDAFEAVRGQPALIGAALLCTGGLLLASDLRSRPTRGWRRFGLGAALLVGLAQSMALTPGISRSGATICMSLLCGLKRRWAGQFSFLIAIVPILGASVLHARDVAEQVGLSGIDWGPILAGSSVAAAVGYAALRILLVALQRAKLRYFAVYCFIVGIIAILAALTDVV